MDDDRHDHDEGDEDDEAFDAEEAEPALPLDRREAARVRRDLDDLSAFRDAFEPDGFKGVSLFCDDCVQDHFYEWDMLEGNLRSLLESGETPMHEPAFDPRPEEYVDWDYAQGYLDGLSDAGGPPLRVFAVPKGSCPFCAARLPRSDDVVFCPACGTHLGPARIASELLDRGWTQEDVAVLLRAARIPPLRGLPGAARASQA